ncbi:MAG: glycosyl hydrolase family 28-related protein, partial [Verrucomicrobia bacterium]|nr:glycosyl hydrolase family 28-related protein [Verrucomicrobiota bacterium]
MKKHRVATLAICLLGNQFLFAVDFRVQDFGAKGDGVADDGPAVQRAVAAASAVGKPARIVFAPGKTFRLLSPQSPDAAGAALVELHGVNNLASNCRKLVVKNLEVDFAPLPFVPGVITAVDKPAHAVNVAILPGFDLPVADGALLPRHPPFFGWLYPPETGGPSAAAHYFVEKITETETGSRLRRKVRLFAQENTFGKFEGAGIAVGAKISVPIPGAAHLDRRLVCISDCTDVTLADWSVWTAPYFAFTLERNGGTILVTNVTLAPKPDSGRMMAAGRDGFHCKGNRGQMIFDHCTVSGLGDDCFNISSMTAGLHRRESGNTVVARRSWFPGLGFSEFAPGDLISFCDLDGKGIIFSARATAVEPFAEKSLKLVRLAFANPLPALSENCLIYNLDIPSPGAIIRNSHITGSCRMRAPLLIERSTFTGFNWFYGDDIEGPFPRRVMIRDSHFVNGDPANNRGDALVFVSPRFS